MSGLRMRWRNRRGLGGRGVQGGRGGVLDTSDKARRRKVGKVLKPGGGSLQSDTLVLNDIVTNESRCLTHLLMIVANE